MAGVKGMGSRSQKTAKKGWEKRFLAAFVETGNMTTAAEQVKVHRSIVYARLKKDAKFKEMFDEAEAECISRLEDVARDMALKENHPTMVIFLLKCRAGDKYKDRATVEHTGANDGPIEVVYVNDWRRGRDGSDAGEERVCG
tara:strand:+ start:115 stop:540 length:426 start_codon:yes stop_codon:yes gene_type:complete